MTLEIGPISRWLLIGVLSLAVASCQTGGEKVAQWDDQSGSPALALSAEPAPGEATAATPPEVAENQYFIEFRSRYALSYGHSFVIFGQLDEAGNMVNPEVAGLAPASESTVPYMLGHLVPVPAATGWSDGDLEDEYMSANWRVMLDKAEYDKAVASVRKLQRSSPVWHAALYNCNAFVGEIAASMGYKTPFIWLKPQQYITKLREMNGGPNAIGTTRQAA